MTLRQLNFLFPDIVLQLPYPKAYPAMIDCPTKIRGVVLGCDPSNFSGKDGTTNELEFVFGIDGNGKDERYFSAILKNLKALGIEKNANSDA